MMTPMSSGYAVISPVVAGSASITVTHPDSVYPAKIAVRVRPASEAKPEAKKYVTIVPSPATLSFHNNETVNLAVRILGTGVSDDDADKLVWKADGGFTVTPAGLQAAITSTMTEGTHRGSITITHPNMPNPLVVPIAAGDKKTQTITHDDGTTEEIEVDDLVALKNIYTGQNSLTLFEDTNDRLNITASGLTADDRIEWRITKGAGDVLSISPSSDGMAADVVGIASGVAEVTATLIEGSTPSTSVTFYVEVKKFGVVDETKPCYLTTDSNVVTLDVDKSTDVSVRAVNITGDMLGQMKWKCFPEGIVDIMASRDSCNITALQEGDTEITVSHPLSNNKITISVHVGDDRVWRNTDVAYIGISDGDDIVMMKEDDEAHLILAQLMHTETPDVDKSGISFKIQDASIADLAPEAGTGGCCIMPKKAGKTIITITHPEAESREINLIVKKSDAALSGASYLTTTQNIVTMIQGDTLSVAKMLKIRAISTYFIL